MVSSCPGALQRGIILGVMSSYRSPLLPASVTDVPQQSEPLLRWTQLGLPCTMSFRIVGSHTSAGQIVGSTSLG